MNYRAIVLGAVAVIGVCLIVLSQRDRSTDVRRAVVGLEAPDFMVLDKNGSEIRLSHFSGKTVFVHYWASWCKECKEEMPEIQDLYLRKKSDPNYVFISVIYNEDPKVSGKWLRDNNFDIPFYVDPKGKAARDYGLTGVPETFLIDPEGILRTRILGPTDWKRF